MRTIAYISVFFIILAILGIVGCNKGGSLPVLQGNYSGKFTWFENGIIYRHGEARATFTFNGNNFSSSVINEPPGGITPYITDGTFKLSGDTTINFVPNTAVPQSQIVQASGTYRYQYFRDSLIFTLSYSTFTKYQYRLKRN